MVESSAVAAASAEAVCRVECVMCVARSAFTEDFREEVGGLVGGFVGSRLEGFFGLDPLAKMPWSSSEFLSSASWSSAPAPKKPGGGFRVMGFRVGGPVGALGFLDFGGVLRPKPMEVMAGDG